MEHERMVQPVDVGGGAAHEIPAQTLDGGSLEWALRYYDDVSPVRYIAASVVSSFEYLLSGEISTTEAIRRLRMLRAARTRP